MFACRVCVFSACISFFLHLKWLFCVAVIQGRIILYLLTFSVFLQCRENAQPNQGLLWGGVRCSCLPIDIWWKGVGWKKHLTPWGRGLTPKLISDMLCLCVKRSWCLSGKRNSFYHWQLTPERPLSELCEVCWRVALNFPCKLFFLMNEACISWPIGILLIVWTA